MFKYLVMYLLRNLQKTLQQFLVLAYRRWPLSVTVWSTISWNAPKNFARLKESTWFARGVEIQKQIFPHKKTKTKLVPHNCLQSTKKAQNVPTASGRATERTLAYLKSQLIHRWKTWRKVQKRIQDTQRWRTLATPNPIPARHGPGLRDRSPGAKRLGQGRSWKGRSHNSVLQVARRTVEEWWRIFLNQARWRRVRVRREVRNPFWRLPRFSWWLLAGRMAEWLPPWPLVGWREWLKPLFPARIFRLMYC